MIFKHKKNSFLFPLGIAAIIFLTLAFTSKDLPSYGVLKEDMVQLIMSTDPGFSHQSLLLGSDPNTLKGDLEIAQLTCRLPPALANEETDSEPDKDFYPVGGD